VSKDSGNEAAALAKEILDSKVSDFERFSAFLLNPAGVRGGNKNFRNMKMVAAICKHNFDDPDYLLKSIQVYDDLNKLTYLDDKHLRLFMPSQSFLEILPLIEKAQSNYSREAQDTMLDIEQDTKDLSSDAKSDIYQGIMSEVESLDVIANKFRALAKKLNIELIEPDGQDRGGGRGGRG
jgi:hypothetical protein